MVPNTVLNMVFEILTIPNTVPNTVPNMFFEILTNPNTVPNMVPNTVFEMLGSTRFSTRFQHGFNTVFEILGLQHDSQHGFHRLACNPNMVPNMVPNRFSTWFLRF